MHVQRRIGVAVLDLVCHAAVVASVCRLWRLGLLSYGGSCSLSVALLLLVLLRLTVLALLLMLWGLTTWRRGVVLLLLLAVLGLLAILLCRLPVACEGLVKTFGVDGRSSNTMLLIWILLVRHLA